MDQIAKQQFENGAIPWLGRIQTSRLSPPLQIKIKTTFSRSFVHIRFEYNKIIYRNL
jgi:hypothetical protein